MNLDPHKDQPVELFGAPLKGAPGAVILLHGRGGSAEDILSLAPHLQAPQLAYLAPEAAGNTWYPLSFLSPREKNEPWLSSALNKIAATVQAAIDAGIPTEHIVIAGFSQGACLATEFVVSHPKRYGGLIAFTGGLIGPNDAELTRGGDLAGTPALFASGDPDPHVPWQRVHRSAQIVTEMGGVVSVKRYPGRAHTVSGDELAIARKMIHDIFAASQISS